MNTKEALNLILLNAARVERDARWNWKGINTPTARIYMIESGSAKVILPDGPHTMVPGHLYLIPSFVTHSCEGRNLFTIYYIHLYEEHNIFDRLDFPFEVDADDFDLHLMKRLLMINPGRELANPNPESYNNMPALRRNISINERFPFSTVVETKGILFQLFSRFLDKSSFKHDITDKRIVKLMRYVRENIHRNITLAELSGICFITRYHLIRLFKKELNCTPLQYINRKKIEKAQMMLLLEDKSIKEIAYGLGFENVSNFYRLFKKTTGFSPHNYKTLTGEM